MDQIPHMGCAMWLRGLERGSPVVLEHRHYTAEHRRLCLGPQIDEATLTWEIFHSLQYMHK